MRTYRGTKCGWQGYDIGRDFRPVVRGRRPLAEREFRWDIRGVRYFYGPPTHEIAGSDGYRTLAYCTTLEGRVLAPTEHRRAREGFRYDFIYNQDDTLQAVSVQWVHGCAQPYPPFRPIR